MTLPESAAKAEAEAPKAAADSDDEDDSDGDLFDSDEEETEDMTGRRVRGCVLECSQTVGASKFMQTVDPRTSILKEDSPHTLVSRSSDDDSQETMTAGVRMGGVDVTACGTTG